MNPERKSKIERTNSTTLYVFSDGAILCMGKGRYRQDIRTTLGITMGGFTSFPFIARSEMVRLLKQFKTIRKNELAKLTNEA